MIDATIPARNFTRGPRRVDLIVLHTTESDLHPGAARAVASWFAGLGSLWAAPQASSHYVIDCQEVIACVPEESIAWAAPGANEQGVHVEMCGRASWTANDWAAPHAVAMVGRVGQLVAEVAARWSVPLRRLTVEELRAGERGLCGHVDVSEAWHRSDHWDPGPAFPWDRLLASVTPA